MIGGAGYHRIYNKCGGSGLRERADGVAFGGRDLSPAFARSCLPRRSLGEGGLSASPSTFSSSQVPYDVPFSPPIVPQPFRHARNSANIPTGHAQPWPAPQQCGIPPWKAKAAARQRIASEHLLVYDFFYGIPLREMRKVIGDLICRKFSGTPPE